MRKQLFAVFLLALALLASAGSASAQKRVTIRGYGEADLDAVLRSMLRNPHTLVTQDRLVARNDTLRGDVLVVRARLIVEGTVIGNVVGVDANMYFRPNSVVNGTVTNVAGGFYPSEQSRIASVDNRPLAPYHVRESGDELIIEGTNSRPALKLGGIFGFQNPAYNRVDGVRLEFGPTLLLPPFGGVEPSIFGSIGYATERGDLIKRAGIGFERNRSTLRFGWEDEITVSNDLWIRSELKNSLSAIGNGKDYLDYYAAQRVYGEFNRTLERGTRTTRYWIRGQREDASPLRAGSPWSVLEPDSVRPNRQVTESSITSLIVGVESEWSAPTTVWEIEGWVETAGSDLVASDFAFNMYAVSALYAMRAIANHTLEIEGNFRGPLPGTDGLPLQRWTHVGGSGTLYTEQIAAFQGDRLFMVESEYTIPFSEKLRIPIIGLPMFRLMHNIGMAWTQDDDRDFEQNIGARLEFTVLFARYVVNPRNGDSKWSAGLTFPSRGYSWEKAPLEK